MTLNLPYGSPLTLSCSASGYPIPSVYWKKDGMNISMYTDSSIQEDIEIIEENNTIISNLHINYTTYNNTGEYVCYAENNLVRREQNMSTLLTLFVYS